MLDAYLIANISVSFLLLALGALVILKSSRVQLNRIFLLFCIFTSLWILSNYSSNRPNLSESSLILTNHLVLFFSALALLCLAQFTTFFTKNQIFIKLWKPIVLPQLVIAALTLTPLMISDVTVQKTASAITFGPLAFLYFLLIALNTLLVATLLIAGIKKTHGDERRRIITIGWSFLIMLTIVIVLNAVVPLLTGSFTSTNIGPLAVIILAIGMTYSMIKHKLFDIRSFVVRAAAYFLTLFVVSVLYIIPAGLLFSVILDQSIDSGVVFLLALSTLVTAVLYQPLRRYFNKVTNKFFYRDYYEPQEVLDQLSDLLVGTVNVSDIKQKSSLIIKKSLRPLLLEYWLVAEKSQDNYHALQSLLRQKKDLIEFDTEDAKTRESVNKTITGKDVALAARLRTRHEDLGFMVFGYKQSGGVYTDSDKKLIGIAADEIAIGLQNALRFEEIERFNVTLQQKIDDATLKLRHANTRLKELDEAKDEFVSMASHQLRTPLTVIKGYLSMLLEGDMGKVTKQQKEIIQTAYDGAERMVFLIGDLLNVSRLQTGKFQIENQPSDLSAVIDHEVSHLQESAANHQLKLTFNKPKDFPKFMLDETKIRQVIMNFIDNAIYYTPAGGSIDVKLETTDREILFTVNDTGLGVPKAEQHHLFSKFYRAGNARKMRPDGTGLGLYMAKKIIVAQGGAIIFRSEEGKGSTFGFNLPKKAVGQ